MFNTQDKARKNLTELSKIFGDTFDKTKEPINYELYYNDTGSEHGSGPQEDLFEFFIQRIAGNDHGLLDHFELYWELVSDREHTPTLSAIFSFNDGSISERVKDAKKLMQTVMAERIRRIVKQPYLIKNYLEHRAKIEGQIAARRKIVLVAHSEGSLIMEQTGAAP